MRWPRLAQAYEHYRSSPPHAELLRLLDGSAEEGRSEASRLGGHPIQALGGRGEGWRAMLTSRGDHSDAMVQPHVHVCVNANLLACACAERLYSRACAVLVL